MSIMSIGDEILGAVGDAKPTSAPVTGTSHLYTDLGFDSLSFVRLLVCIEETYSIPIDLMEMETCLRVDQLIALVENKLRGAGHDSTPACQSGKPGEDRHHRKGYGSSVSHPCQ